MAKKLRKLFAVLMVLLLCMGQAVLPAMAAETGDAAPVAEAAPAAESAVQTVQTPEVTPAAVEITASVDSAQAGPGGPGGGGQSGSTPNANTSVDHIDINVDAGGTVQLGDSSYYVDIEVERSDAENVTITNEGMEGYTDMHVSGGVSTSTDANNEQQIRIEGSFDIGTMENPTEYTVQLVKDVTVGEGDDAQEITVTLSTTTGYWDLDNLCPPLWNGDNPNSQWQEGMFMGSQTGIDLQLKPSGASGGNTGEEITNGQLTIQKTVIGLESGLAETTQFYFDVTDDSGNVVYNDVAVTVGAGQTIGILVIENVEFGTYTIVEIVNENTQIEGYDLETTYNLLDGSAGNVIVVTEENDEGWINVNNIYVPKPTDPVPTDPEPTDPQPTDPEPTDPQPTDPEPTDPEPTDPEPTDPKPTDPKPTEPDPTDPKPTEPEPTDPGPSEPVHSDPEPADPVPLDLDDETEIPDEEVPLAAAPKTGDISLLWVALSGLSAGGLVMLNRKRED